MPTINEDSFFYLMVDSICRRPVIFCTPETSLAEMARLMKEHNISGIAAVEEMKPVGIVSLRDLRDLIAESVTDFTIRTVRDIMKSPLITIRTTDYLFKAVFLMAKHNIHRLVVIDEAGCIAGLITDTDILRIQTRSPLYLVQEIETANTLEQLFKISKNMPAMLRFAAKTSADTRSIIQLIAHFNDAFTQRLITILDQYHDIRLPEGAAFLAMGSEGREEQTLRTDQDNAIVYRDDLSPEKHAEVIEFSRRIVTALESVGVPLCPGNMMANNPGWCRSLSDWKQLTEHWITKPGPNETVYFGVFQDLRVIHGDTSLADELRAHIIECSRKNSIFFARMARNIVRFKTPMGMFGRLQVEKKGENRGKLDIKKGGLFALTRGICLLALEAGIMGGTTWSKMDRLKNMHMLSDHDLESIEEAFTFLIKMRLDKQLLAISSDKIPGNYIDPLVLNDRDRDQLRSAFRGVNTLLHFLGSHYQLDLMAR